MTTDEDYSWMADQRHWSNSYEPKMPDADGKFYRAPAAEAAAFQEFLGSFMNVVVGFVERDGVRVYGPHHDGSYTGARGGQWFSGSWQSVDEAVDAVLAKVAKD